MCLIFPTRCPLTSPLFTITHLSHLPPPPYPFSQLPEQADLWYDDGTAEPEYFLDDQWPTENKTALLQTICALVGTVGTGLAVAHFVMPVIFPRPVARWEEYGVPDLRKDYGMDWKNECGDDYE